MNTQLYIHTPSNTTPSIAIIQTTRLNETQDKWTPCPNSPCPKWRTCIIRWEPSDCKWGTDWWFPPGCAICPAGGVTDTATWWCYLSGWWGLQVRPPDGLYVGWRGYRYGQLMVLSVWLDGAIDTATWWCYLPGWGYRYGHPMVLSVWLDGATDTASTHTFTLLAGQWEGHKYLASRRW